MNAKETKRILASIAAVYPSFTRERDLNILAEVWQQVFSRTPYEAVNQALMAFIARDTKGFPPTPGALNAYLIRTEQLKGPTENEAWARVYRAISRGLYNSGEEFAKLPPDLQELVGSARMLYEWAQLDAGEVNTVIASNFKRSWRTRRELERDRLPAFPELRLEALEAK